MNEDELANRFRYHSPATKERQDAHEGIRSMCRYMAEELNKNLPEGREKALAMTHLEEVMFWANAAIARTPDE